MSKKLTRFEEEKILYLPFKYSTFFAYLLFSVLVCGGSLLVISHLPLFGLIGIVSLIGVYCLPSIIAFDVLSLYNATHNAPRVLHPRRFFIVCLNIFLGVTGIGWMAALAISISPGTINATTVKYITLD